MQGILRSFFGVPLLAVGLSGLWFVLEVWTGEHGRLDWNGTIVLTVAMAILATVAAIGMWLTIQNWRSPTAALGRRQERRLIMILLAVFTLGLFWSLYGIREIYFTMPHKSLFYTVGAPIVGIAIMLGALAMFLKLGARPLASPRPV